MQAVEPSSFLRQVLLADAAVSGTVAIAQLAAAPLLGALLMLSPALLLSTGAFLLGYVILLIVVSRASAAWTLILWIIIAGNVVWGIGCLVVSQGIEPSPSTLGTAYLVVQALAVWVFAWLEYKGLRASKAARRLASA
jgi:hypothetical protein